MSKNSVPGSGTKTQAYYPKPLLGTKASSMFEPAKKPETPPQWHGFRALVLKKFPKATVTKAPESYVLTLEPEVFYVGSKEKNLWKAAFAEHCIPRKVQDSCKATKGEAA